MSPDVPQKIGHYEILGVIGRGGMATVYKAYQPSLNRIVAIKVLPPRYQADPVFVERFNREAQAVAMMNHPNIVQIIDKDRDGDLLYFVMEYVPGLTLQKFLRQRRLTLPEALHVAKEVGKGLECAHRTGIVHRDLNPRNILVSEDLATVKVADFGISRVDVLRNADGTISTAEASLGTLFYLAPEQGENPSSVDQRADIYSLGVVCYEMLTGKVPVGKFSLPSQLNKSLPPEVDAIVLKCLASDPAHRYASVAAWLTDLKRFEHDAGLALASELKGLKRSTSLWLQHSKTGLLKQRRAMAIGAGVLLAVSLLVFGTLAAVRWRASFVQPPTPAVTQASPEPTAAEVPQETLGTPAPLGPAEPAPLSSKAYADTAALPTAVMPSGVPVSPAVVPERTGRPDAARPPADAAARTISAALSKFDGGQLDAALADAQAFLKDYPGHPRTIEAKLLAGRVREKQGRPSDAVVVYEDVASKHAADPRSADALVRHALILLSTPGKDLASRDLLSKAIERSPDGPSALAALVAKGGIEERRKMYERDPMLGSSSPSALISYRTITERFPKAPDAELAWWKVGEMYESTKRYPQAAQAFVDLGTHFPETKRDAWFRAAELFDKRLDKPADARAAYLKVPSASAHYAEAQRRATALSR